jgi:hypothetical protein
MLHLASRAVTATLAHQQITEEIRRGQGRARGDGALRRGGRAVGAALARVGASLRVIGSTTQTRPDSTR